MKVETFRIDYLIRTLKVMKVETFRIDYLIRTLKVEKLSFQPISKRPAGGPEVAELHRARRRALVKLPGRRQPCLRGARRGHRGSALTLGQSRRGIWFEVCEVRLQLHGK